MPMNSYQYGTSPRKYEPEYTTNKRNINKTTKNKEKEIKVKNKVNVKKERAKKAKEKSIRFWQVVLVLAVFGMLLTVSYREIAIMEIADITRES